VKRIRHDGWWIPVHDDGDRVGFESARNLRNDRRRELGKSYRYHVEVDSLRIDPGSIEEVAYEPVEALTISLHQLQRRYGHGGCFAGRPLHDGFQLQEHGLQWCPQVVRHERHEVLTEMLKLLERGDVLEDHDRSELHAGLRAHGCGAQQCWGDAAVVALDDDFQVDDGLLAQSTRRGQLVCRQGLAVGMFQVVRPTGSFPRVIRPSMRSAAGFPSTSPPGSAGKYTIPCGACCTTVSNSLPLRSSPPGRRAYRPWRARPKPAARGR
jgi:hypothetical protein